MRLADWKDLRAHAPGGYRSMLLSEQSSIRATLAEYRQHAARVVLTDLTPVVGVSWFPILAPKDSVALGCLARVEANHHGRPLDESMEARVQRCVRMLVGLDDAPMLDTVTLTVHGVPTAWEVAGRSLELAAVLSMVSALVKTPLKAAHVVSGQLGESNDVEPIGGRDDKKRICALEAPGAQHVICDTPFKLLSWLDSRLSTDWKRRLYAALNASPARQSREAWLAYETRDNGRAERLAARARTCTSGYERALAHWVEGACRMHRGDPQAIELLMVAVEWFQGNRGERRHEAEDLSAFAGGAMLDNGRADEAVDMLQARVSSLQAVEEQERYVDWARAMIKVAGSLRRALVAAGQLDEAIRVQRDHALPACRLAREEAARCLLDLGATLTQANRTDEAREVLAAARDALPEASGHFRAMTQRYLDLHEVRAGVRQAGWLVAPFCWRDHPQPLEALEQLLAEGADALDVFMHAQLAGSERLTYAQLLAVLRVAGVATVRWGPRPWTRALADAALSARPGQDATMREAIEALRDGNGSPFLRVAPY